MPMHLAKQVAVLRQFPLAVGATVCPLWVGEAPAQAASGGERLLAGRFKAAISRSKCRPLKGFCAEAGSVIPDVTVVCRPFQDLCTRTAPDSLGH